MPIWAWLQKSPILLCSNRGISAAFAGCPRHERSREVPHGLQDHCFSVHRLRRMRIRLPKRCDFSQARDVHDQSQAVYRVRGSFRFAAVRDALPGRQYLRSRLIEPTRRIQRRAHRIRSFSPIHSRIRSGVRPGPRRSTVFTVWRTDSTVSGLASTPAVPNRRQSRASSALWATSRTFLPGIPRAISSKTSGTVLLHDRRAEHDEDDFSSGAFRGRLGESRDLVVSFSS